MELDPNYTACNETTNSAWIVLGLEGTGSKFLAKTLSYVLGKCNVFGEWDGSSYNNNIYVENIVFHRSLPYMRPKKNWIELEIELNQLRSRYKVLNYLIATRDLTCSINSKIARFGGSHQQGLQDYRDNIEFLKTLLESEEHLFLWSYETMITYGDAYFRMMYEYFNINSGFIPPFMDQNSKYINLIDP